VKAWWAFEGEGKKQNCLSQMWQFQTSNISAMDFLGCVFLAKYLRDLLDKRQEIKMSICSPYLCCSVFRDGLRLV